MLTSQFVLPPPTVRPKFVRTAQLAVPPEQAEAALPGLGKTAATLTRRQSALRFLIREPDAVNVSWVYAESGCNLADLQELDERGLIVLRETEIWRDPLEKIENWEQGTEDSIPLELTTDQQKAWDAILAAFQSLTPPPLPPAFAWRDRLRQDRALPARNRRSHPAWTAGHHPCPGDRHHPADGAAFHDTLPWTGGTYPLTALRRGALRHLAARPPGPAECGHWAALGALCAPAKYRPDRGG